MLQIARLTDYGLILLTHLAQKGEDELMSCADLADETHLPTPTVRKVLKTLAGADLLASKRGAHGGYSLARAPEEISVASVIEAMEGPVAITVCSQGPGECELEPLCGVSNNWQRINAALVQTLERISVADMVGPLPTAALRPASGDPQASPQQIQRSSPP
ncbi:MAG: SUF system Fe-S cluster assembly regulator [Candidatus Thermoplasmatota archaeon]|nr:SUF system Fe-S cluster assembly regulator [Candidatus Thermoplasmatota archaeon]